ncbi:hypothetical protein KA005_70045, partial [bacterium]|nr:hypothetical protein [bacterium]
MKVKKHIMFVSYAMRGHANQMIVLAQELVSRRYQVSFVMPDSGKEWLINTAVHFISWKPILKTSDKGFNDAMKQVRCRASREQSARRSQLMVLNMLIDAYIPMYKSLLPIFHKYLPDLLVIAHPVLPAMDLAEKLNLPLIIQTRYLRRSVRNIPKSFDFSASFRLWMNQGVLNLLRQLWLLFQFGIANRRLDHIRKIFFAKV